MPPVAEPVKGSSKRSGGGLKWRAKVVPLSLMPWVQKTWEENCKWRLDPSTPSRYVNLENEMRHAKEAAAKGFMITQKTIGGYMYLRSLLGPERVMYAFLDQPELIHDCMKTWFELADTVIAKHQEHVTLDELFLAEDICYNHGILISPDMMREFLFPYYQQLIANIKSRQIDRNRHLYVQIDTDGYVVPAIPVYEEIGMELARRGVLPDSDGREPWFLCYALSEEDVAETLNIFNDAVKAAKE